MNFLAKLKESVLSVLPIAILIIILGLTIGDFSANIAVKFSIGCVFVILGMTLFSLGADMAMMPIGNLVGSRVTKSRNVWLIAIISLVIGVIITIAEPDLLVLATRLDPAINKWVLIVVVAIGVGLFLALAMLRIVFKWKLKYLLLGFYTIAFILAIFVDENFFPLAFDSGGITTGPMTVPFIMALGLGVTAMNGSSDTDDSFGLVALCSIGPIIMVLILGLIQDVSTVTVEIAEVSQSGWFMPFLKGLPEQLKNVAIALGPICVFFIIFRFVALKDQSRSEFVRIIIGILYTYVGLVIFLTGVEVGFQPAGSLLGQAIGEYNKWLLIPIGAVVAFLIIAAEPAVHILVKQVDEVSGGTIKKSLLMFTLMIGVSIFAGLAMLRVATGVSLWYFLVPGYAISMILMFFVPKSFTAIAFDSGGVASGPMTATFLLPFAMGACSAIGGNVLTDAFGLVAMVAFAPIPSIQLLGLIAKIKQKKAGVTEKEDEPAIVPDDVDEDVVEFDENTDVAEIADNDTTENDYENEVIEF